MPTIFTIPKAGTQFMTALMQELNISTPVNHYSSKDMPSNKIGNRNVVLVRDLRDVMCAVPFWIDQLASGNIIKNHIFVNHPFTGPYLSQTASEKLLQCISKEGLPQGHMEATQNCCKLILELMKRSDTFVLRFEDVIGKSAGGNLDDDERIALLQKVCKHIRRPRSAKDIRKALDQIWGKSHTYNPVKKKVHRWEALFEDTHKEAFIKIWDAINLELGYSSLLNLETTMKAA